MKNAERSHSNGEVSDSETLDPKKSRRRPALFTRLALVALSASGINAALNAISDPDTQPDRYTLEVDGSEFKFTERDESSSGTVSVITGDCKEELRYTFPEGRMFWYIPGHAAASVDLPPGICDVGTGAVSTGAEDALKEYLGP